MVKLIQNNLPLILPRLPILAQKMDAAFLDAGEYVVVLWQLKGLEARSSRTLKVPVTSVYRMHSGKIVESQMFYADGGAIAQFLAGNP
jgi:hypothetical protein